MRGSEQEVGAESPGPPPPRRGWLSQAWEWTCSAANRLAVHVGGAVGLYFAVEFAFVHDANPTGVANAAFAITATLAALSFSYARNLDSRPELQVQAVAGGERLLRGAILMILASLLQYADLYAEAPIAPGGRDRLRRGAGCERRPSLSCTPRRPGCSCSRSVPFTWAFGPPSSSSRRSRW